MHKLEVEMLSSFPLKPSNYYHYIESVFQLSPMVRISESIKFIFDLSNIQIPILDVLIKLHAGPISITLYCKPFDMHLLLDSDSVHLLNVKSQ